MSSAVDAGEVRAREVAAMNDPDDASRRAHDATVGEYDRLAREAHWYPELVFGLCFEYLSPGEHLLALGVGTGLCVGAFHQFGLRITGVDNSPLMLAECRRKAVTDELALLDITATPWPWPADRFDHAIAVGVLHFIDDLAPILTHAAQVVREGGLVAFTTKLSERDLPDDRRHGRATMEIIGEVPVYAHRRRYVSQLMAQARLDVLKQLRVCLTRGDSGELDTYLIYVTRRSS